MKAGSGMLPDISLGGSVANSINVSNANIYGSGPSTIKQSQGASSPVGKQPQYALDNAKSRQNSKVYQKAGAKGSRNNNISGQGSSMQASQSVGSLDNHAIADNKG